jgi:hypothetical protein
MTVDIFDTPFPQTLSGTDCKDINTAIFHNELKAGQRI